MYGYQNGVFLGLPFALRICPSQICVVIFSVKRVGNAVADGLEGRGQVVIVEFPWCYPRQFDFKHACFLHSSKFRETEEIKIGGPPMGFCEPCPGRPMPSGVGFGPGPNRNQRFHGIVFPGPAAADGAAAVLPGIESGSRVA